uniref:Uncharacterized protein n=1 Tax=Glossina pallidipes TaxID=7398 RepID=A0A1B0A3Z8_GLOPL
MNFDSLNIKDTPASKTAFMLLSLPSNTEKYFPILAILQSFTRMDKQLSGCGLIEFEIYDIDWNMVTSYSFALGSLSLAKPNSFTYSSLTLIKSFQEDLLQIVVENIAKQVMQRIERGRELVADLLDSGSFSTSSVDQSSDKIEKPLIENILRET